MTQAHYVRVFPSQQVTSIDAAGEAPPEAGGLTRGDVEAIWRSVEQCYQTGIHPAITICLRRHGQIVLHRAIGHTHGNAPGEAADAPKTLVSTQSLFNLFSASKAITAMTIHHLNERGLIHLDDALAEYLPEFGRGAKRFITVRHVLTHQAGVPKIPESAVNLDNLHLPGEIRNIMAYAQMQWQPGRGTGYHALTGGFIMGALVEAISGMDLRAYLQKYFTAPLGMRHFNYGVAPHQVDQVAVNVYSGKPFPKWAERVARRVLGVSYSDAINLSNDPRFLTGIVPAGNLIATAEETSRFYEMLLNGGELGGVRVLQPRTIRRAVQEQTHLIPDRMLILPMRYSMGFMLGRSRLSLYGSDTPRAFGHLGMINVVGYADPERDIAVGIMNNGKPGLTKHVVSFFRILEQIAQRIAKVPANRQRLALAA